MCHPVSCIISETHCVLSLRDTCVNTSPLLRDASTAGGRLVLGQVEIRPLSRTLHRFSRQINVTLRAPNPRFDFSNMAPRVFGGWICNLRPSDVSPSKFFASRGHWEKKKVPSQLLRLRTSRSWTCKSSSPWDYELGH